MMRIFILSTILFVPPSLLGQAWYWQNPLPQGNWLHDIEILNGTDAFAVGDVGTVLRTVDGGITWVVQHNAGGTANPLWGISFADISNGIAVGHNGTILRTINGGLTWTSRSSGVTDWLNSVAFVDSDIATAVGGFGTILRTTDGGDTWLRQASGITAWLYDVAFPTPDTGFVVGSSGTLLRTVDGGSSWTRIQLGIYSELTGVSFSSHMTGTIVGYNYDYSPSHILRTSDGGLTWTDQGPGANNPFTDVSFVDENRGIVVGYQIALRTTNGGTTWISRSFNSIQWLDAASLGANDLAFIVGNGGVIARSTDGGGTWIWPTNTFSQTLSCSFVDANTGTICGEAGLIARTTDKGATWTVQYHGEDPDHFYDVQFLNPDMGAVVGQKYSFGNGGGGGFVLFTSNGGTTWRSSYPPGPAPPLFAVHFVDPNVGMVTGTDWNTGSDGRVYYTTNRGLDWTDVSPGLTVSFGDVHLLSEDIAFLVGSDGTILQTSNGGMDWLPQESGTTRNLSDICFANDSVAYVVGDSGVVLFSSDAGATWLTRTSPVEEPLRSASFTDANIGTVVGGGVLLNGRIYRTVDGAQTWEDQSPGTSNYLTSVSFVDANTGWAVGAEGTIFHTTTGGVGIEPPVALIAPPDGAVVSTDTVVLMWHEGSSGVDRYWLEGATDSLFTEPFIDSLSTDTSKTLYQRQHNQTYWWRAKAHNSVGWGPLSEVWSFFVYQEIPSSPMLLLPDSGATGVSTTPTFSWNPSLGTEYYAIQLSDTLDFSRLVVDEDSLGATSLDITGLSVNSTYYWRVSARNALGTSNWSEEWSFTTLLTGVVEEHPVPVEFSLSQNYPNPFNPTTTIRYGLPLQAHVTLEVFNILGQRVSVLMDEAQDAGYHEVTFGGGTLSSGLYFYRLRAGDFVETRKLVLVR